MTRRNNAAATGRGTEAERLRAQAEALRTQEAEPGWQRKGGRRRSARPRRGRRAPLVVGALLLGLIVIGGVIWLARQQSTTGGSGTTVATGQPVPGLDTAFPATQGSMLSLKGYAVHRKLVLYFYEGST